METQSKRALESYKNLRIGDTVNNGFETNVIAEFFTNPFDFTYIRFEGEQLKCDDWHLARNDWKRVPKPAVYIAPAKTPSQIVEAKVNNTHDDDDFDKEEEEPVIIATKKVEKQGNYVDNDITKRQFIEL